MQNGSPRELVDIVCYKDHGLAGVADDIEDSPGSPVICSPMKVVRLVQDHEGVGGS